jgi:hypothetical protein
MASPYTLDDTFRSFDQTVYSWLGGLLVNYSELGGVPKTNFGILRCYATPRRAYATMKDLLIRKGWMDRDKPGDGSGAGKKTIDSYVRVPLPFASITRNDYVFDTTRFSQGEFTVYSPDYMTAKKYAFPKPINIPYQIEFWYREKFTEAHILEWLYSKFGVRGGGHMESFLNFTPKDSDGNNPFGTKVLPWILDSTNDNSDLEPGDQQRTLRLTASFTMKGWMFLPPISGPDPLDTVFAVPADIKRYNPNGPYCSGETLASYGGFSYNLIYTSDIKLKNVSGIAKYVAITEDKTIKLYPGSSLDYLYFDPFIVLPETYEVSFQYFCIGGTTDVRVLDSNGGVIYQDTLSSNNESQIVDFTFNNGKTNNLCSIRFYSDKRLILKNIVIKRATNNYVSGSSESSDLSVSSLSSSFSSFSSTSSASSRSSTSSTSSASSVLSV